MSDSTDTSIVGYPVDLDREWLATYHDLYCAVNAIKRERINGHLYLEPRLSEAQVTQRQQILQIAEAVLESARKRALQQIRIKPTNAEG